MILKLVVCTVACFFNEFLATAILLMVILAVNDKSNDPPPVGLVPLVLFIVLLGETASLGMQTGFAMNPARDLGPRIALAMVGYGKDVLFDYRRQYWLWTPILGPLVGGMAGAAIYDGLLFTGNESIFNKPLVIFCAAVRAMLMGCILFLQECGSKRFPC